MKLTCTLPLLLALCAQQTIADDKPDPSVFKTPAGWKVEVLAKAPDIQHPSVVTTSPDGRIFVGEDPVDMHLPSDAEADRILCIRPDGTKTVFAEKLHAVYGMEYIDGKLIVHHPPFISVFTDDDSGISSKRVDIVKCTNPNPWASGGFNDHIPANFRLAMDGYLYMSVGDKGIFGAVGTDGSKAELRGGGVLRLRPDGSQLEVYSTGTRNHLDLALNAEDELFTYDNTDDGRGWWTRYTHMVDGGYYGYPWDYWPNDSTPEKVQKQIESGNPGQPFTLWRMNEYGGGSPCGAVTYSEDALPAEYRENNFHCEWGKGRVERFVVKRAGGSYEVVKRDDSFLLPGGEFRPVGICVTHDGAGFLITDWNFGGWKNKDQDGKVGRLIRMTYTGEMNPTPRPAWYVQAGLEKPFDASTSELVDALRHPARSVRMVTQRRISERGADAISPLVTLLNDAKAPPYARWHAIWTLDAIDGGKAARKAIASILSDRTQNASVRRQAARQLGGQRAKEAVSALAFALDDSDASVRFHAATALGRIGDRAAIGSVFEALRSERDLFARYAMFRALNRVGRADAAAWADIVEGLECESSDVRSATGFAVLETHDPALVAALTLIARNPGKSAESRALALAALAPLYKQPKPWDGKWWSTQPVLSPRPAKEVEWAGTRPVSDAILAGLKDSERSVRLAAVEAAEVSRDRATGDALAEMFRKSGDDAVMRPRLLRALAATKPEAAADFIGSILKDPKSGDAMVPAAVSIAEKIGTPEMRNALIAALLPESPAGALAEIAAALGRLKHKNAVAALTRTTKHADTQVAVASIDALAQIGGDGAVAGVLPSLEDSRVEARRAAAVALGKLASPKSIEPLLQATKDPSTKNDAILALASTPDVRAVDAYLEGLGNPDGAVRKRVRAAVIPIAVPAWPSIAKRLDSTPALSKQAVEELQKIYSAPLPIPQWSLVGPFPRSDAPPPFDVGNPPSSGQFSGAEGPAQWKTASPGERGAVDLGALFKPDSNVAVYAIARLASPIAREAELMAGSDDAMTLWINGKKVIEDNADGGWNPDEQRLKVQLIAGDNVIVARVGNTSGAWQFSVAVAGDRTGKLFQIDTKKLDPSKYGAFAMKNPGDSGRGKAIFFNVDGVACVKCHKATAGGEGGDVGPSLAGVGGKYDRSQLIESILYPSKQIFDGYQQTLIRTKSGSMLAGSIRGETEADLTLLDANGVKTVIKKSDVDRRKVSELSLMPEDLHASLKLEDFADLIAYLQSLKEK